MAYIDKTYFNTIEQYKEICDWCHAQGTVTDDYGNVITPTEYLPHKIEYDDEKEEFIDYGEYSVEDIEHFLNENKNGMLLWSTDTIFDVYLIRYCPVKFIQDRLKEQYSEECYQTIKDRKYVYDTYKRNGLKNPKLTFKYYVDVCGDVPVSRRYIGKYERDWYIYIRKYGGHRYPYSDVMNYDDATDYWFSWKEAYIPKGLGICNCKEYFGTLSKKTLARMIRKWNIPSGYMVECADRYGNEIKVSVK